MKSDYAIKNVTFKIECARKQDTILHILLVLLRGNEDFGWTKGYDDFNKTASNLVVDDGDENAQTSKEEEEPEMQYIVNLKMTCKSNII